MKKEYIMIDGQKYQARDMVESLVDSISLHQQAIRKIIGITSSDYDKLSIPFVSSNLDGIIDCVEQLKRIQEQLSE